MAGPLEHIENWLKQAEQFSKLAPVTLEKTFVLHKGESFQGSWIFSGTAAGEYEQVMMICNEDYDAHALIHVSSNADALFELFENPTITTSGTFYDPRNLNRTFGQDGSERSRTLGFISPTLAVDGYILTRQLIPGGVAALAGESIDDEWVLRRNQAYVFRMYNRSAGASQIGIRVNWAEHDHSAAIDGS